MKNFKKEKKMSTTATTQNLKEYASILIAELVESSTNPRRVFDEEQLEELAGSIRSKGILSPLVVRQVNGRFEIIAGARRFRAAQRAASQKFRFASGRSATPRRWKFKSSKTFNGPMCIRLKKRSVSAPYWTGRAQSTPLKK